MSKITKYQAAGVSLVGVGFMFLMESIRMSASCIQIGEYEYENICRLSALASLIFVPILFFALVSFMLEKQEIFASWIKFTAYFFIVNLLLVIVTPWYWGDGFMNIQKETNTIGLAVLYAVISLVLISYKSYKLKGN